MLFLLIIIILMPPAPPSIIHVPVRYAPQYPISPLRASDFRGPRVLLAGVTDGRKKDEDAPALHEYQVARIGKQHYCIEDEGGKKLTVARYIQQAFVAEMARVDIHILQPDAIMAADKRQREAAVRRDADYVLDIRLTDLRLDLTEEHGLVLVKREIALDLSFYDARTGLPAWQGVVRVSMPKRLLFPANDEQVRELMTDVLQETIVQALIRFRDAHRARKAA